MNKISSPLNAFFSIITLSFLVLTLAPKAQAATPPSDIAGDPLFFIGPVGQSLGGAVYSFKSFHDNLLVNSSAGSFSSTYGADGTFSTAARTLGASVFDTKSTSYGGGLTYIRREVDNGDTTLPLKAGSVAQTYQNIALSVFGKLHESFAIGVTGKYSMRSNTGAKNVNGESWNGDVGATFRLNDKVGFGVAYRNLFGDKKDIELTVLGGGADLEVLPGLRVTGALEKYTQPSDSHLYGVPDEEKITWVLGAQYAHMASGLSIRAAFRNAGPWDSEIATGGLGYVADSFHVNYSYATVTKGKSIDVHTFGLGGVF